MIVGLLSNIKSPMLPLTIASIRQHGVSDIIGILDQKTESEKDLKIWLERTGGAFERVKYGPPNLYAFEKDALPFYFVTNHNSEACLGLINKLGVDMLVNAGTPRKLEREILDSVPHGVINVHPGILPKYRGCTCVEWAIYNDDKIGNTAHFLTESYDEGPIITSEWYEFPSDTDYRSIRIRTYRDGFMLMGKVVASIVRSGMTQKDGIPQGEGYFWNPIPEDKMAEVLRKIETREYKYMRL